jgi:hypothetical protein
VFQISVSVEKTIRMLFAVEQAYLTFRMWKSWIKNITFFQGHITCDNIQKELWVLSFPEDSGTQ